ncbi:MAG TPA: YidC/Oxa1 family insertase periplasmic-domain containing protein [Phycisphaerae bacterium]|nr:YidC/Oxa1 family insertase periplasmic-domain containing protein [Phycisphaerae bacterium]HNU46055.1 YidC/Oxa1 family insertase periplasmic-domain containing protein [Phycisphaerae bacterium]
MDDRKDLLRNLLVSAAVFVFALTLLSKWLPSTPPSAPPPPAGAPTPDPTAGAAGPTTTQTPAPPAGDVPAESTGAIGGALTVREAEVVVLREMGAPAPALEVDGRRPRHPPAGPYRMRVHLCNLGASIDTAAMADHWQDLDGAELYHLLEPVGLPGPKEGGVHRSLSVDAVNVDNRGGILLADKKWHVRPEEGVTTDAEGRESLEFYVDLEEDGQPVLRLTRTYTLAPQPKAEGRFDLRADLRVENLSPAAHEVVLTCRGGVGVHMANSRTDDRFADLGVRTARGVRGDRQALAALSKKPAPAPGALLSLPLFAPTQIAAGEKLTWVATANTYFTCTLAPLNRDGSDDALYLAAAELIDLDREPLTDSDRTVRLITRSESVPAGGTLQYPFDLFLGPKLPRSFQTLEPYAARNYYYQIAQGFGWCTFAFLVELMLWLLNGLHRVVFNYGVAIIILVLIVRGLLHPLTKKGQVDMVRMQHRMQELAPKIEEIKKKYANDKARMNQEMMKLNINPVGQMMTCLPMFIQMPIWVALWLSLSNNIEMRHEPFFGWIRDLTAPDALYTFVRPLTVPLLGWQIVSFNLLPLLLALFMYTQQKLTPRPKPSPNMTEQQIQQQEAMQKMMPIMSIMMLIIFYPAPSGLTLYIMTSSLFGTIEQWVIRKHIKAREAAGTLHKPERPRRPVPLEGAPRPRPTGFFARLQKLAEDAQKHAQTGGSRPRRERD